MYAVMLLVKQRSNISKMIQIVARFKYDNDVENNNNSHLLKMIIMPYLFFRKPHNRIWVCNSNSLMRSCCYKYLKCVCSAITTYINPINGWHVSRYIFMSSVCRCWFVLLIYLTAYMRVVIVCGLTERRIFSNTIHMLLTLSFRAQT